MTPRWGKEHCDARLLSVTWSRARGRSLQTDSDTDRQTLLLLSTDEGRSFPHRQSLTPIHPGDSCPTVATDGRALYMVWGRADRSIAFAHAAQPGTCP